MSTEAFRERLRRLRREDGGGRGEPQAKDASSPPAEAGLPAWFAARAARTERTRTPAPEQSTRGLALGLPERLVEELGPLGPCVARTTRFACDHRHGQWRLEEAFAVEAGVFELLTRGRFSAGADPRSALFFDIETTGLSGGAGTHVFLVGLGWFEEQEFSIWQGFLRGPEEERAFLAAVGEKIRGRPQLVSFFGKSFDRHRLEDRLRIQRLEPPFEGRAHLDLYYAARAVYGGAFEDLRLATLERELVGVERRGDLPGAFAPAAWMDFLAERAHRLEQVLAHNLDDVLSLVALYAHLGCIRLERPRSHNATDVKSYARAHAALQLARLELDRRQPGHARNHLLRAVDLEPKLLSGTALVTDAARLRTSEVSHRDHHSAVLKNYRELKQALSAIAGYMPGTNKTQKTKKEM